MISASRVQKLIILPCLLGFMTRRSIPNHPKIPCLSLPDFVPIRDFKDFWPAGVELRLPHSVGGLSQMKYSYFLLTGIVSLLFVGPVLARDITRQELLN